jgi:hypothetical protein
VEESAYSLGSMNWYFFFRALNNSTDKLFAESCYKLHKVTYAVSRNRQSPTNSQDNFCVRR